MKERVPLITLLLAVSLLGAPAEAGDGAVDAGGIAFFERSIRPVLVESCYGCHAARSGAGKAQQVKGGLRLDTREGLLRGGDRGPAIVPGDPQRSLLIRALRHDDDDLQMPPKKRLPASVVASFEKWIALGAPDPRGVDDGDDSGTDPAAASTHWAFQPVRRPQVPTVESTAGGEQDPIDRFVIARLQDRGLSPSPPADRRTLLRRLYYDLIGLPPTAAEAEHFESDRSPDAYEQVVDRLLASPRHGERWGRHWLDVARFSDTKDVVLVLGKDAIRPYAYTYRDYVIRAFNEDTPYDRFVHDQLGAGEITTDEERWRLAAMGFLTVGRVFNNINPHDIYDDQIDVVTRGFLGLTVTCARCHDHKYDPIPTADYYSLHGIFANCVEPHELPLLAEPVATPEYEEFARKDAEILATREKLIEEQYAQINDSHRRRVADYLVKVVTTEPDPLDTAIFFLSLTPGDLLPQFLPRWRALLRERSREDDPIFGPWHDFMELPQEDFAARAPEVVERWSQVERGTARGQLNARVAGALANAEITSRADVARTYGDLFTSAYVETRSGTPPEDEDFAQILPLVTGRESPFYFAKRDTPDYMTRVPKNEYRGTLKARDVAAQNPAAPPRAMTLVDARELYSPRVFVRGDPSRPGREVPRRFLSVLTGDQRKPFTRGSGRLELASAIASPGNPLTSRVIANRIWMHHFGEPLVSTPSDFGLRSDPPSHPALLDYLASTLVSDGWSLKALHRRIVLSGTYRQSSRDRPDCRAIDPENRLLWRSNRRRLGLEAMRDSFLFASGRLDRKMYGRPADAARAPDDRRRTVYALVDRQDLPTMFRAFDFASPDNSAARRPQTTVPQQALFVMNSQFIIKQVQTLASRPEVTDARPGVERVRQLYRLALGRTPSVAEEKSALRLVAAAEQSRNAGDASTLAPWEQLAHILLLTNEFLFVD